MAYPSPSLTDDLSAPTAEDVPWNDSFYFESIDSFDWNLPQVLPPSQHKGPLGRPETLEHGCSFGKSSCFYDRSDPQLRTPPSGMSTDTTRPNVTTARKVSASGNTPSSQNRVGCCSTPRRNNVVDLDLPTEEEEILEASGHPHTERSSIWDMPGDLPSPTRTGEREIKCRFPKCGRHCFSRTSELRRHIDTHHRCSLPGCTHTELFTAKGQLDRHKRSVHGVGSTKLFYCAKSGCDRGPSGRGFARKDHLLQHTRSHREGRECRPLVRVGANPEMEAPKAASNGRIKSPRAVAATRRRSCLTNDTSTVLEDSERKEGRKQHVPNGEALVQENKELTAEVARLRGVIVGLVGAVTQLTKE